MGKIEEVLLRISNDVKLIKEKQGIYCTEMLEAQFYDYLGIEKLSSLFKKCVS